MKKIFLGLAALLLGACGSDELSLNVELRTDLVAGVEFARVDTVLLEATNAGTAAGTVDEKRLMVTRQNIFSSGLHVATFDSLTARDIVVLVQLVDARGAIVVERRTRVTLARNFALSVIVTRDCVGVMCPAAGGQPLFAACVAGRCVDERCHPSTPEFCPAFICDPETNETDACPPHDECADVECASGICLFPTREPALCSEVEWCDPFEGCAPINADTGDMGLDIDAGADGSTDASMGDMESGDAFAMDSGADALIMTDLGVSDLGAVDAGITCTGARELCEDACVDLSSDLHHCGDCDIDCSILPHVDGAAVACTAGACQVASACVAPFAHCSSDPLDGCETDLSLASSCGACSTPCSGGTPLCSSDTEGRYSCASGCNASAPTLCGTTCVNLNTNPLACGSCGSACPVSDHGQATCSARTCGIVCDAGYHLCGSTCVSDLDPETCGGRCTACASVSNGNATCDGTSCGFACATGFHACGSLCVDNTSISSCGSSCTTCPGAPAFGMATCDGFVCDFVCLAGYHRCGNACVRDDSVTGCGAGCITCSAPPANGTALCASGACTSTCNAGFHACSGSCSADSDPTHCGAACMLCTPPSGGSATCTSGVCGTACPAGTHLCGGACLSNTSTASCGTSSCSACAVPMNGAATCNGTTCGTTCNTGYTLIGSDCDLPPPRPIWPLTSHVVTSHTPTFRWALNGVTTGAVIDLCNNRSCSSVISSTTVVGTTFTPAAPLPARSIVYWRLRARYAGGTGLTQSATWQLTTGALSTPVSTTSGPALRDVNGDGYADVVVGAPTLGRAYVFHGHMGAAPSATPDATLIPPVAGAYFGESVATCDVNSDGYADTIVGQSLYSSNAGRFYVYYGSATGTNPSAGTTVEAPAILGGGKRFGYLLECAGDMDGDGFSDVVSTAITRGVYLPGVFIYAGSATGLATTPSKSGGSRMDWAANHALDVSDINGDGYSDVTANSGAMLIFYGGPGWMPAFPAQDATIFTYGTASLGDNDGDGYSDIATLSGTTGRVTLQRGGATGVNVAFAREFDIPQPPDALNYPPRFTSIDMNVDSFDDLVVGDPQGMEGRVYIYQSSATLPTAPPTQTIFNPTFFGKFGASIARGGDVDGDGRIDLIVGTQSGEVAYVYLGQASGLFTSTPAATIASPSMGSGEFGACVR